MPRTSILGPLAFTAADNTILETYDANWTPISGGGGDGGFLLIRSNRLVLGYGVSPRIRFRNTRTYATDQWIGGAISGMSAGLSAVGFLLRMSADVSNNDDWYAVEIDPTVSPTSTTILKCSNGSVSTLATSTSIAWADNDTVEFEATGTSSTELKVYKNGGTTAELSATDSSSPLTSGKPGISFRGPGIGGGNYGTAVDNLDGGDVTSGGSTATAAAGAATVSATGSSTARSTATAAAGVATVSGVGGTLVALISSVFKNNTGTALASLTNVTAWVNAVESGALVVKLTSRTTSASGICTLQDAAIVSGTTYRVTYRNESTGDWGAELVTAT